MSALIKELQDPDSLPDPSTQVTVVQTHISVVFVADKFVYKIKKPVNFGFLDFSTLENRKYFCHREVELNRRLSKGIYLDVLPVVFDGKKHSIGEGPGKVVEYAVKMRRIHNQSLMKSIYEKGKLTRNHLHSIGKALARFHNSAERNLEIDKFGEPDMFKVNTDENFQQVENFTGKTIKRDRFDAIRKWTEEFYSYNRNLFFKRIDSGRVRDCHGDLHMEHICFLGNSISIIDCIEFNDRFRYGDTLADIAFLIMDLEYHSGENFSSMLWDIYRELADEKDVKDLLTFYKVYRAFVRGKVNSFQLDDESIDNLKKENAIETAKRYFNLAYSYI